MIYQLIENLGAAQIYTHSDGTYFFAAPASAIVFEPFKKPGPGSFKAVCDEKVAAGALIACNGPLYSVVGAFASTKYNIGLEIDPNDIRTDGLVYQNGGVIDGRSAPSMFYINQNGSTFSFGSGDPPSGSFNAIGGLGPLLLSQYRPGQGYRSPLRFGPQNLYDAGVEPNPSPKTSGSPHSPHVDNLTVRGNLTVSNYNHNDGIMAAGISRSRDLFLLVFRGVGKNSERESDISSAINHFLAWNCEDALFFDGSTSITARTKSKYYVSPDGRKDNSIEIGFQIKGR